MKLVGISSSRDETVAPIGQVSYKPADDAALKGNECNTRDIQEFDRDAKVSPQDGLQPGTELFKDGFVGWLFGVICGLLEDQEEKTQLPRPDLRGGFGPGSRNPVKNVDAVSHGLNQVLHRQPPQTRQRARRHQSRKDERRGLHSKRFVAE